MSPAYLNYCLKYVSFFQGAWILACCILLFQQDTFMKCWTTLYILRSSVVILTVRLNHQPFKRESSVSYKRNFPTACLRRS